MNKLQKMVLFILSGILVIMLGVLIVRTNDAANSTEPRIGDFIAPEFDVNAVTGKPENIDTILNYQNIVIEDRISVSMCGNLFVEEGTVDVYFTSDENNDFHAKVKIYSFDGKLLGETGLIKPGEYVESIVLDTVPEASTSVIAKILTYEPNTYYSKGSINATIVLNVE